MKCHAVIVFPRIKQEKNIEMCYESLAVLNIKYSLSFIAHSIDTDYKRVVFRSIWSRSKEFLVICMRNDELIVVLNHLTMLAFHVAFK